MRRLLSSGNTSPYTTFASFFPLRSAGHTPLLTCGRRRIPVFVPLVSAAVCRTTHPSGSRPPTSRCRARHPPLALCVPQKTVGSLPGPMGSSVQITWLPRGSSVRLAHDRGVTTPHNSVASPLGGGEAGTHQVAQLLTRGRASHLAEARRLSSPLHRPSPAKRRDASMSPHAYGHHHRPSTHCEKLSEVLSVPGLVRPL